MASITRHGKGWRAFVGSGPTRRSRKFPTKAAASAWALEQEAHRHGRGIHTLHDAIERYERDVLPKLRSAPTTARKLTHFKASLKFVGERIDAVTPDHIATWRDERLKSVSALTVRREITVLSAIFTIARKEWRWVTYNPCHDVTRPKAPPPRDQVWGQEDIDKFIAKTGFNGRVDNKVHEVAVAFLFALETAMRAGEILSLTPDQIRGRVAYLEETKNGDRREVPLSKRALELWGMLDGGFSIDGHRLDALFRKYRDRAGIRGLRFHDTRRTATSRMAKIFDVMTLAKITGHRDVKILLTTYYRADAESLADKLG